MDFTRMWNYQLVFERLLFWASSKIWRLYVPWLTEIYPLNCLQWNTIPQIFPNKWNPQKKAINFYLSASHSKKADIISPIASWLSLCIQFNFSCETSRKFPKCFSFCFGFCENCAKISGGKKINFPPENGECTHQHHHRQQMRHTQKSGRGPSHAPHHPSLISS